MGGILCVVQNAFVGGGWVGDKDKKDLCPSDAYSICFLLLRENAISKDLWYYMSANIQIQGRAVCVRKYMLSR